MSQQENNERTLEHISSSGNDRRCNITIPTTDFSDQMQFSTENENISHDPGNYWDAILTEKVRELWIRKGSEFFQNKDCDFSEASRSYIELHDK